MARYKLRQLLVILLNWHDVSHNVCLPLLYALLLVDEFVVMGERTNRLANVMPLDSVIGSSSGANFDIL